MKPSDIVNEVNENKPYVVLGETPLKGYFKGEFKKEEQTYSDGQTGISYIGRFITNGKDKEIKCSGALITECTKRCEMREIDFYDAIFSIVKTGNGKGTRYTVEILGTKEGLGSPTEQAEPSLNEDGVPF